MHPNNIANSLQKTLKDAQRKRTGQSHLNFRNVAFPRSPNPDIAVWLAEEILIIEVWVIALEGLKLE